MTVSHKAGDILDSEDEFDALIRAKFSPRRHALADFQATIPVSQSELRDAIGRYNNSAYKSCSGESCRQGRAECETPEACRLPDAYHATSEGIVRGVLWGTAIIFCTALAALPWLLEYLAP